MRYDRDMAIENPDEQLLTINQAAERYKLSASHLRRLVRTNRVGGKRLGRDWVTTQSAVEAYLATERKPGPKSEKLSETD